MLFATLTIRVCTVAHPTSTTVQNRHSYAFSYKRISFGDLMYSTVIIANNTVLCT